MSKNQNRKHEEPYHENTKGEKHENDGSKRKGLKSQVSRPLPFDKLRVARAAEKEEGVFSLIRRKEAMRPFLCTRRRRV
jgi:hypothetical protein